VESGLPNRAQIADILGHANKEDGFGFRGHHKLDNESPF
jgi:hypothetical protein